MSQSRLLRAADYPRMPWKNGAGSTLEITRDAGDGLDGFGWRLSIADVGESGGFSAFTGYQRVITVLEGAGMRLEVDGHLSRDLTALDAFAFDGGSVVDCELLDGPIRDFNLIYSPQRYTARLQWLPIDGELKLFSAATTLLLFAADGEVAASLDDVAAGSLGRHDCLHLENQGQLAELKLAGTGTLCLIELTPR
ncbi:HutD family protein [Metapseudomonas resinovorans]|uniref:Putative histidine utilization protein HutD n=1 Tax=Metapseudomonas resinovorans NBRC 106553 TaxID=1245471 RepID=S6AXB0_METRE|nr:HutD family protein [Pseudomonas resinovorans]BAN51043.1 putative histidine utilization protein HutD [Pseudomonas resinovorans NBRC 106553]